MSRLGGWKGYRSGVVERYEAGVKGARAEVWIDLLGWGDKPRICNGCGSFVSRVHDWSEREIRDLPVFDMDTVLMVARARVACPKCGPSLERLDWLEPHARVTNRLAENVARMCKVMPIKRVAEHYNLHWGTVKAIDKAYLKRVLEPAKRGNVRMLLMDEFALHKGHRYATVIMDAETKRVLWVGKGRSREEVRPFFEWLGKRRCQKIQAVGMDMWPAFEAEVRMHCPNAEIVFDQFHVVANFGKDVIDKVRIQEAHRVKDDKAARELIKGAKWNLLGNWENLPDRETKVRLNELLEANQALMTVYVMKDALKALWGYTREGWARKAWDTWLEMAQSSGLKQLERFAKNMTKRIDGILAHCRWKLNTSVIEGVNNKIKVIKRTAYGYRDEDYFFLKIRAAFPGNP
jgi:transposase